MPLTLYRRHSADCAVNKTKISSRAKRLYMACDCPIWMLGRTGNSVAHRQSTRTRDRAVAEAILASLDTEAKGEKVHGPKLADCIELYVAGRKHELSDKTEGQIRLLLNRLETYCSGRGV